MKHYDLNGDGTISYEEFVRGLRDELTPRRFKIVEKVYSMLDPDNYGRVSVKDIVEHFHSPAPLDRSKGELLMDFLSNFEGAQDGFITRNDFFDYYSDISMTQANDDYFVKMMEHTWQCRETVMDSTLSNNVQMLLREVRERVLDLAGGDRQLLKKVYSGFDKNHSGTLTLDEVQQMFAKLRIQADGKVIYQFFKTVDADNSGGIEYPEFEEYIFS